MQFRAVALLLTLALGLLAAPLPVEAQRAEKVYRIGVIFSSPSRATEAIEQGLRELGYIQGQNIHIEWRFWEGRAEWLSEFMAELVQLEVDLIVAGGEPVARAAKRATKTIPIVFPVVGDPVETGLIASLARPGGNLTGFAVLFPELSTKRLELLKEAFPHVQRVAVLWNSANPAKAVDWKRTQRAAWVLRLTLQSREVRDPEDFDAAFTDIAADPPDALFPLGDPLTFANRRRIIDFAAQHRLPVIYEWPLLANLGGLMAYGPSPVDLCRRSATYVDKILKGAKPADLPVEQARKFYLVINLKTAKALGLTIPPSVLMRADRVIE